MAMPSESEPCSDIIPQKLGLRCNPPALTLVYKTEINKRARIMPVRFLNIYDTSVDSVSEELKNKHKKYLEKVPDIKIKKMLRILQETQKGIDLKEATAKIDDEFKVDPNVDLNKVSDEELTQKKQIMDSSFQKTQIKADDPEFQYDVQVDYKSSEKIDAGWDSDNDADFWS